MWIIVAVILALVLSQALNRASKKGNNWDEVEDWTQMDEDLDDD